MSILHDHHIILERFRDHRAFRGIDKQTFDIDSSANRIYLPADRQVAAESNVSPHPSRHVSSYVKAVCKRLNQIAEIESPVDRIAEIRTLIDAMRVGFANGDLYTNVPIDKTRDEVDRGVAKVLTDDKAYLSQYPDQLKVIRDLEKRGADAGLDHLIKWLLYLGNPERRKQLDEVIDRNPGVNITAGNQDLNGTWLSKFAATDPTSSIFRIPGSTAADPNDLPPLRGYNPPSLAGLDEQERLTRSDPRFTGVLPAFPLPDPIEQQLGQLPPTTAAPSDPLVLKFDPMTGAPLPFHENPLMRDPSSSSSLAQDILPWLAGGAALAVAAPFVPAWLAAILAGVAVTSRAANAREPKSGEAKELVTDSGGVFSTGAPAYNAFINGGMAGDTTSSSSASWRPGSPLTQRAPHDQEAVSAGSFVDRFGSWIETPAGIMPIQNASEAPAAPAAGALAPDDVRRLTRANASNAGSVFTSGSAPVPYLPSQEFNDRFGSWSMPNAASLPQQASKPIGAFGNDPSYSIPPPIFGSDDPRNPRNDAEEWFSRWIRPHLPPE
jgi:hypothetical protein